MSKHQDMLQKSTANYDQLLQLSQAKFQSTNGLGYNLMHESNLTISVDGGDINQSRNKNQRLASQNNSPMEQNSGMITPVMSRRARNYK
jgi:hypothetical protein